MIDLALKIILYDRLRFAVTVAGVGFAVTLVLVQSGLFFSLLDNASITIEHLDAEIWVTPRGTANLDFSNTFPDSAVKRVRSAPGVAHADNLIVWFSLMRLPNGAREQVEVYALEDFERWKFPWKLTGDRGDLRRGHYFFLDSSARARFGGFETGDYREIGGHRLKLTGISQDALSFTTTPLVFMRMGLAQGLDDSLIGQTSYILVKLERGANAEEVQREIQQRLPNNDVFLKKEWMRRTRSYWMDNTGLGLNMMVGVLLGAMVGVAIVVQTLYSSTMEHLKEFGTVKAIGGSNADIYQIIVKQATLAAFAGFIGGVPTTHLVGAIVEGLGLRLIIPMELYLVVLVGAVVLCLLAGVVSFFKVAGIDPAMVFRN